MKQITSWRPDTCGCTITYEWDDTTSEDDRVHTAVKTPSTRTCPAHRQHTDHVKHFEVVLEENQRKNKIVNYLIEKHTADPDNILWNFDADRLLTVKTKNLGLKAEHLNALQTWVADNKIKATVI